MAPHTGRVAGTARPMVPPYTERPVGAGVGVHGPPDDRIDPIAWVESPPRNAGSER